MSNPIVTENLNTGTTAWDFRSNVATTQIQAYSDVRSLDPGQTINFFVSTQVASTSYSVNIYRLGWYGGNGGCLKSTSTGRTGVAQGYWDEGGGTLNSCPTAISDSGTHNLEAGWTATDSWAVPSNACTGIYAAIFTDANGKSTACTFVVRGNTYADYVVVQPDTTDAAYNDWGGYSLYTNPTVGTKVSFNRPQSRATSANQPTNWMVFSFEMPAIRWLEAQGYNLAYLSDVDLHATSGILNTHQAYLSLPHDEYWTLEMRNAVETARSNGIGIAFLGANTCYWQMRFETDNAGHANRTLVCYKVQTFNNNLATDPFYGVDNTRVTTLWRDALLGKAENGLVGVMYKDTDLSNVAWTVDNGASASYLAGTGLVAGSSYGNDLVGYEFDQIVTLPKAKQTTNSPANLQTLGTSTVTNSLSQADTSHSTTYIGSGGALVFASGSISWTWALDAWRWDQSVHTAVPGMQALMTTIMAALIRQKNPTSLSSFGMHG